MINNNEEVSLLLNVETNIRILLWAQQNCPGDDLGRESRAQALMALGKELGKLDELRGFKFDAKAAHDDLMTHTVR